MTDQNQIDLNSPDLPDMEVELADKSEDDVLPPCSYITGAAGTGKTFSVRQRIEQDPKWGLLTATTGIAAVNLGTTTLHSALGLHPDSIEDDFLSGKLQRILHQLALQYRNLVIDEVSMLGGRELLDYLYQACLKVNEFKDVSRAFGLVLVGDFCQLPPIKQSWAFEAECWPRFEDGTERLTKNWRQGDGMFLDALNHLRSGDGPSGALCLSTLAHFDRQLDPNFDGTVIVGRNDEVDRYNWLRYSRLKGYEFTYPSYRWGKQSGGWNNIPETLKLKVGSYVMVLANDTERDESGAPLFRWVNGDCGHVVDVGDEEDHVMRVQLVRTKQVVDIEYVERRVQQRHAPDEFDQADIDQAKKYGTKLSDGTFYDPKKGFWVRGAIRYMPLRLAYATTVHKSQGLTLDRVQVDLRNAFLGQPAMSYVALSRCRTADGLHLVGSPEMLARRTRIDEKVRRWL